VYGIFYFFFFQAEDGIRDRNVTGVQTCALPIWRGRNVARFVIVGLTLVGLLGLGGGAEAVDTYQTYTRDLPDPSSLNPKELAQRSEERRVGKECRSRWWRYRYKKNKVNVNS